MNRDLLLEIGVEEMPSVFMSKVLQDLKELAQRKLEEKRLAFDHIQTMGTPRRMVLHVKALAEMQADALIENRGPKKSAAFDKEGKATKAAMGFARGQGLEVGDLVIREQNGIEYLFAVKTEQGLKTSEILPNLLLEIIHSLSFPKSMRWGSYQTRFARPIRWILALYGNDTVDFALENVAAASYTYGHRFLSPEGKKVSSIENYFQILKDSYVILDQEERKKLIWQQVQEAAREAGGEAMVNEELLEEVSFLVEYPTAFYGQFSPSYLEVPPEVLTTSMIENQRYFPVFDKEGKLMPGFIGVRNGTDYSIDLVRAGNERVLKARLEDALFFWKEDTKKPLEDFVAGLENVVFQERLGTVMDKVKRLQTLGTFIVKEYKISEESQAKRAAYLCKADLLSSMVFEFTELQGIMGRYYARKSGEKAEVAEAVFEHYLPRFAGDSLPQTETGLVLSLAEKTDNLVGSFCIGIRPTGSQDPYALRRQALGIVNIVLEKELKLDLRVLLQASYDTFASINPDLSMEQTAEELVDFIKQRLRGVMLERGFSYDVVDAVLVMPGADLTDLVKRAGVLQEAKSQAYMEDFMVVFNRSNNLSKKWDQTTVDEKYLEDETEIKLCHSWKHMESNLRLLVENGQYQEAMQGLAKLRPELDDFFEAVMVMVDDENLRAARLSLLKSIAEFCFKIADFSKLVL